MSRRIERTAAKYQVLLSADSYAQQYATCDQCERAGENDCINRCGGNLRNAKAADLLQAAARIPAEEVVHG